MARFIYNSRDLGELFLEAVNKEKTQISGTPAPPLPHLRVKNKPTIVSQLPSKWNSQVCIITPFLPDKENSPNSIQSLRLLFPPSKVERTDLLF